MGEPGEPVDGVTSSEGEIDDPTSEQGRLENGDGHTATASAPDSDAAAATAARVTWSRRRRVVWGIGAAIVATIVTAVGGVAARSGAGDDRSSPADEPPASTSVSTTTTTATSTTTSTSTTTTVAPTTAPPPEPAGEPAGSPAADDEVMTPVTEPSHTAPVCGLGPWGESHPQGTGPGPPESASLVNGPNWNCANAATGCNVSISTTWSDGVTASDSRVLTAPGTYTLNDGRGTTATFSVSSDLYCGFNSADYTTVWPPGA